MTEPQGHLNRLLELVEPGLMDGNDPTLKERLDGAKLSRQAAIERMRLFDAAGAAGAAAITDESISRLAVALRKALQNDDPSFLKAYQRLFVSEIVVSDTEIRMHGPTAALRPLQGTILSLVAQAGRRIVGAGRRTVTRP